MLIDTHAHLTDERYGGAGEIIASMKSDGLEKIITVAYDLESSRDCVALAEQNENIYCAVGVHPNDAQHLTVSPLDELLSLSRSHKCVAIGEIGLDYHYDDTDKEKQNYWLDEQFKLVEKANLPVCFHIRDAYEDFFKAIARNSDRIKNGAVMHCYSGSLETACEFVKLGFYISFSGSVTFKNAKKFTEIIRAVPLDKLLVETDCPYLTPHPYRGETNYPKMVRLTAEKIAEVLEKPIEEIERITRENAYRIFTKMKR